MTVTQGDPFLRRFTAYLHERFPVGGHILLIISYYSSNQFLAQALLSPGAPLQHTAWSLLGGLSVLCGFYYLRVFDEHKDYEDDRVLHPGRLLSRGVITLRELRATGAVAIAIQLVISALRGGNALVGAITALIFAVLMLKEFFVGAWLRKHFLIYAFSHMLIMPLFALQIFSFTTLQSLFSAPPWYLAYAWVGFFVTLTWEISRKIKSPQEEREGLMTYSRVFGTYGAGHVVLCVRAIDTLLVALVGYHLDFPWHFYFVLATLYIVCVYGFLIFRLRTNPKTAHDLEKYAGIYIIAFDLLMTFELIAMNGIQFRLA